jgi:hypothetical protein
MPCEFIMLAEMVNVNGANAERGIRSRVFRIRPAGRRRSQAKRLVDEFRAPANHFAGVNGWTKHSSPFL